MIRLLLLMTLAWLQASPALAEGYSGYAEARGFAYPQKESRSDPGVLGWGTLFAKWEGRTGTTQLTASLRGEWLTSGEQNEQQPDLADRRLRRAPISMPDLWARLSLNPAMDLQLGRFQLGWGKTDGYSPADAFLPRDLTDPFRDEKLPLWGVRLNGEGGALRYDAIVCPVTTPWRLPELGSRNAPLNLEGMPAGISFRELASEPPVIGFAALRLQATFDAWDLGTWFRAGVRPAPLLSFRFDRATLLSNGLSVPIERRYAREEGVGVELSRVAGAWILRGEAAALFSGDSELGDALIGALSAEKGFGDGTLLVTLAGNAIEPPVDATLLFDRAILPALIVAWTRNEPWGEWKLVWTSGLKYGDGQVKGELGYNLSDVWKLSLGSELPYGPEKGPFGALAAARRLQAALRRSW